MLDEQTMKKIAICLVILLLFGLYITRSSARIQGYEYDTCTTLWDLAERHCPSTVDKWDFIEEVKRVNGIENSTVYADRLYQFPIYK